MIELNTDLQISKFYFFKLSEKLSEKQVIKFLFEKKDDTSQSVNIFKEKVEFIHEMQQFIVYIFCVCKRCACEYVTM